jgi:hypothetical protein
VPGGVWAYWGRVRIDAPCRSCWILAVVFKCLMLVALSFHHIRIHHTKQSTTRYDVRTERLIKIAD